MKINLKLIIAFALALLITSVSVSYVSFSKAREIAEAGELKNMSEIINLIDINVTSKSRLIGNTIQTAAASGTMRYLFANLDQPAPTVSEEGLDFLGRMFQELGQVDRLLLLRGEDVYVLRLAAAAGGTGRRVRLNKLSPSDVPQDTTDRIGTLLAQPPGSNTAFFGVGQNLLAPPATPESKVPEAIFAGIRLPEAGAVPLGILCAIDVKTYYNILPISMGLLQNQTTFILDGEDRIISANKSLDQAWVDGIVQVTDLGSRKYNYRDGTTDYFVYKQYNGLTGWNSYTVINADRIFPEQAILKNFIINFALVTTVFSGFLFVLMSTHFTRPLKELIEAMRLARQGNYGVHVDEDRRDEIGDLNKAYNFLLDEINRLIHQVYEEKLAIRNAQLTALQAQINPHFLYNTLDSINWMLIDKGDFTSSRIIQSLGRMLRYSISTEDADVTLADEISFVKSYLLIQKNRMEDRLDYSIEIPPALLDQPVPRLFLQPIVENAIKHGLNATSQSGKIRIWAEKGDGVRVVVEDTGVGMSQEAIDRLGQVPLPKDDDSTHIGLANVDRRIKLKYGEDYGLSIQSRKNQGTAVTIRLPKGGSSG